MAAVPGAAVSAVAAASGAAASWRWPPWRQCLGRRAPWQRSPWRRQWPRHRPPPRRHSWWARPRCGSPPRRERWPRPAPAPRAPRRPAPAWRRRGRGPLPGPGGSRLTPGRPSPPRPGPARPAPRALASAPRLRPVLLRCALRLRAGSVSPPAVPLPASLSNRHSPTFFDDTDWGEPPYSRHLAIARMGQAMRAGLGHEGGAGPGGTGKAVSWEVPRIRPARCRAKCGYLCCLSKDTSESRRTTQRYRARSRAAGGARFPRPRGRRAGRRPGRRGDGGRLHRPARTPAVPGGRSHRPAGGAGTAGQPGPPVRARGHRQRPGGGSAHRRPALAAAGRGGCLLPRLGDAAA